MIGERISHYRILEKLGKDTVEGDIIPPIGSCSEGISGGTYFRDVANIHIAAPL